MPSSAKLNSRAVLHGLVMAVALLGGCGGSGGESAPAPANPPSPASPPVPPVPPVSPPSGYDLASQIAAARAHPSYGAVFTNTRNPDAPQGLALPTAPQASCLATQVNVSSLAQFNAQAAGSCKRITLAPSATPYLGSVQITGQDIEAVFTGTTITPTHGNDAALQITGNAQRVKTIGGSFNNGYVVGGRRREGNASVANFVSDVHVYGASFSGLYTQGLTTASYGDGGIVRAHRFALEHSSMRTAEGGFFVEGGSTNLVLANSNIVVPKLDRHENPVRINGGDLVVLIDSRLRTELGPGQSGPIKHTWRIHASYENAGLPGGRMLVKRVQSEGGGAMAQYPGVEGPHNQSTELVVEGWRYYRGPEVEGNNIAAFPHLNTYAGSAYLGDVMNGWLWMDDNVVYLNGQTAGGSIMGANTPPGSVMRSVYAAYVVAPEWAFR